MFLTILELTILKLMLSLKVFVVIEVENEAEVDFFVQNIGPGKKENCEFIKTRYFEILLRRLRQS